jgi:hypothetical protein
VLIGEDEHSKGIVTVRNLVQRGQERPFRQTAVAVVKAMLADARRTQRVDEEQLQRSVEITKNRLREQDESS